MERIRGIIIRLSIYYEEGRIDWLLSISKVIWFLIWIMLPFALFRFVNDLFGLLAAIGVTFVFLILMRLAGPSNLVMLDELMGRLLPTLRTAVRMGSVRVLDFRVRTDVGTEVACLLRGDLLGALPMAGDQIELEGNLHLGSFFVRRGINVTTGAILALRPSYSIWILAVTLCLAVIFFLYLSGYFDNWLYRCIVGDFE